MNRRLLYSFLFGVAVAGLMLGIVIAVVPEKRFSTVDGHRETRLSGPSRQAS